MDSANSVYQNLWKSLVLPPRTPYSDYDMGGDFLKFSDELYASRLDFKLKNALNEHFSISMYLPCDKNENIQHRSNFVVYCHTHTGSRIEGLSLAEQVISQGLAFVVFDFRANGFSSGKYVTLGWYECLDINAIVHFLKTEAKAKSICLWGRSMGGSAILFYLSESFRGKLDAEFNEKKRKPIVWENRAAVECVVIDACFPNLINSLKNLSRTKMKKLPEVFINLILGTIAKEVQLKADIDINQINPGDFSCDIQNPVYLLLGSEDELVAEEEFYNLFRNLKSNIKKIKLFKGGHSDERPDEITKTCFDFIEHIFSLKNTYAISKKTQHNLNCQPVKNETVTCLTPCSLRNQPRPVNNNEKIQNSYRGNSLMRDCPTVPTIVSNSNQQTAFTKSRVAQLLDVDSFDEKLKSQNKKDSTKETESDASFTSKAVNLGGNAQKLFDSEKMQQQNEEDRNLTNTINFDQILREIEVPQNSLREIARLDPSKGGSVLAKEYVNTKTLARNSILRFERTQTFQNNLQKDQQIHMTVIQNTKTVQSERIIPSNHQNLCKQPTVEKLSPLIHPGNAYGISVKNAPTFTDSPISNNYESVKTYNNKNPKTVLINPLMNKLNMGHNLDQRPVSRTRTYTQDFCSNKAIVAPQSYQPHKSHMSLKTTSETPKEAPRVFINVVNSRRS